MARLAGVSTGTTVPSHRPSRDVEPMKLKGLQEVAGNLKSALDKSLGDQPMATLAAAAIVGFVLGVIWKA